MAEAAASASAGGASPAPAVPALPRAAWVGVAAAAVAAHATSFLGRLQFDDFAVIAGDPRVQSLGAWWRSMPGIRPLLKLSYAANAASGLGLAGFHAVNLALHVAAALLALALLLRLSRRLSPALPPAAAVLGALLFALHPVQTEAVAYLSGRSSALCGALSLASALVFVAGRDRGRPALAAVLSPALLLLALGAKEAAAGLPAALVLCEALDRRRPFRWGAALRATAAHWAVLGAAGLAFLASPAYRRMLSLSATLRPPLENALTHAQATLWLAGQLVRPHRLVADPALPPVTSPGLASVAALAAVALAAALAIRALRPRVGRAEALCGFAVLWLLLWLAPQGWALPRPEPASERQLYLALLGPAWAAGAALAAALARARGRTARAAVAALVLVLVVSLGIGTAVRSLVYRDEVTFWTDVVEKAPHNARAHANLGHALALACRPDEAETALREALRLDPGFFRAAVNLQLLQEGTLLDAAQVARCREGAALAPP